MPDSNLDELIARLPEVYQPLYGVAGDHGSSRPADGLRVDILNRVAMAARAQLGRPLRVLDLGSAQGFLAMTLGAQGDHVTGIDFEVANVDISRALAERAGGMDVVFHHGDIAEAADLVDTGSFDLVLAFSVLHHLAHRDGHEAAVEFVGELAQRIPFALAEMAVESEPLYWAASLPEDPRITLAPYVFMRELGRSPTHLSETTRPIILASSTHAYLNSGLEPIRSSFTRSHSNADPDSDMLRRYFLLDGVVVKTVAKYATGVSSTTADALMDELARESQALEYFSQSTEREIPTLVEFAASPDEALLARGLLPGRPVSQIVEGLGDSEREAITSQLLSWLAELEGLGLFHQDLRTWNVLWDADSATAHLIDYGSVGSEPTDLIWPNSVHFSFVAFVCALWGGAPESTGISAPRSTNIGIAQLAQRPAALVEAALRHERNATLFRDIARLWGDQDLLSSDHPSVARALLGVVETQRDEQHGHLADAQEAQEAQQSLYATIVQLQNEKHAIEVTAAHDRDELARAHQASAAEFMRRAAALDADIIRIGQEKALAVHEQMRLAAVCDSLIADRNAHAVALAAERDVLASMRASVSWRATRPLRGALRRLRRG